MTVNLALTTIERRPDLGGYLGDLYANTIRLRHTELADGSV